MLTALIITCLVLFGVFHVTFCLCLAILCGRLSQQERETHWMQYGEWPDD